MALYIHYKAREGSVGTQFQTFYKRREFLLWQLPVYEEAMRYCLLSWRELPAKLSPP